MQRVDINEFKENVFYYIDLCASEEIEITKDDEVVAVLSNPDTKYYQSLERLNGCLKEGDTGEDYKDIIGEEIMRRCGF